MKVAIIGAGICGLYLAQKLAKKGEKVTVFEKKTNIGKEACSGLFSERILDLIPQSKELTENEINHCLIHFPKKTLKIEFSKKFLVMSHYKLDNLAASLAEREGVKIVLNKNITKSGLIDLEKDFDRIIGADGVNSTVRKGLNLPDPDLRLGIQGFTKKENSHFVETWPTKHGFLWKIPRDKEVEWGIVEKHQKAKELFENFSNSKKIEPLNIKSAFIPQGMLIPKKQNITLCGDAAGLTKPWSGGGVVWGLIMADILLKTYPDFLKYGKMAKKFFLPRIIFSKTATKTVYWTGFNLPYFLPKNHKIESDFLI